MKDKVLIGLVIILTLALFVETAYLLQLHFDRSGSFASSNPYSHKLSERPEFFWKFKPFMYDERYDTFDIFKEMERTQEKINKLLKDNFMHEFGDGLLDTDIHSTEIKETKNSYIVKLKMPGMEKEKINVELKDNYLIVSGEHKTTKKEESPGGFYTQSQSFGTFRKVVPLPGEVNASKVKTEYEDGTLIVTLPKERPDKVIGKPKVEVQI